MKTTIIIAIIIILCAIGILSKDKKEKEFIPQCEVSKKETANSDTITYRTKGEFIYKIERGKREINAVESAISFKRLKTKGDLGMTLLLSTFTYAEKPTFIVKGITIKFTDKSTIELVTNDNIEQPLNDAINVVGNFINLNKEHYNILSTKDIQAIELKNSTGSYRIVPFQKVIKEQIKCILKEINKT